MTFGMIGLIVGSFLNVVIYRLPIMLQPKPAVKKRWKIFNLFRPRSHCPNCLTQISWWRNIPLVSFFLQRGECDECGLKISLRYPLVELLSAVVSIYVGFIFGISWSVVGVLLFSWTLIVLIFIDFEQQILPDQITLGLMWLGLLYSAFGFFISPQDAILGAISGYVVLWSVAKIFYFVRHRQGMGHGDFKLLAALGAWVGWQMVPFVLVIASLLGSLVGISLVLWKRHSYDQPLPFGPYLAISGWIILLHNNFLYGYELRTFL